jgi:hypothetical protein
MVKLAAGVVIAVLVIGVAATAALWDRPVNAGSAEGAPAAAPELQAAVQAQPAQGGESAPQQAVPGEDGHPFIGIVVQTVGDEAAKKLGIAGGVKVTHVLPEGPSVDILHGGDIFLAINGTEIIDIAGLRETMEATSVGDVITISILRDGLASDVDVTVGDRSEFGEALRPGSLRGPGKITKRVQIGGPGLPQLSGILGGILPQLRALEDRFVRAELVLETDDGFRTITAAKGTLSGIDVVNGTFTLNPKDGSDPIFYEISEDTVVGTTHEGDLGGLNTVDETLVVAVDGELKLVFQGKLIQDHQPAGLSSFGLQFPLKQSGQGTLFNRIQKRVRAMQNQVPSTQ